MKNKFVLSHQNIKCNLWKLPKKKLNTKLGISEIF